MGTEIKTREVRRDIKVLDKPAIAAERIRQSHVRTKEDMAQTQEHAAPVEYAEDRVMSGVDTAVRKGVHHVRGQGGRLAGAEKKGTDILKKPSRERQKYRGSRLAHPQGSVSLPLHPARRWTARQESR